MSENVGTMGSASEGRNPPKRVKAYKWYRKLDDGTYTSGIYNMLSDYPELVRKLESGEPIDFEDPEIQDALPQWDESERDEDTPPARGIPIGEERFFNDLPPKLALRYLEALGDHMGSEDMMEYEGFSTYPTLEGARHIYQSGHGKDEPPDDEEVLVEVEGEPWWDTWDEDYGPDTDPGNWGDAPLWRQKILRELGTPSQMGWKWDPAIDERINAFDKIEQGKAAAARAHRAELEAKYGEQEASRIIQEEYKRNNPPDDNPRNIKARAGRMDILRKYVADQEMASNLVRDPRAAVDR